MDNWLVCLLIHSHCLLVPLLSASHSLTPDLVGQPYFHVQHKGGLYQCAFLILQSDYVKWISESGLVLHDGGSRVEHVTRIQQILLRPLHGEQNDDKIDAYSTGPFTRTFTRTAHSFACSSTTCFARALCCADSLARSLTHAEAHGKEVFVYELNASILNNFCPLCIVQ